MKTTVLIATLALALPFATFAQTAANADKAKPAPRRHRQARRQAAPKPPTRPRAKAAKKPTRQITRRAAKAVEEVTPVDNQHRRQPQARPTSPSPSWCTPARSSANSAPT